MVKPTVLFILSLILSQGTAVAEHGKNQDKLIKSYESKKPVDFKAGVSDSDGETTVNTDPEDAEVKKVTGEEKNRTKSPENETPDPTVTVNYNEDAKPNQPTNGTLQVRLLDPGKSPVVVKGVCTDGKLTKANVSGLVGESCEALNTLAKTPGSPPIRGYSNDAEKQTRKPPGGGPSAAEGGADC